MLITIVGLGQSGLSLTVFLAKLGHTVIGVDTNSSLVDSLNKGVMPYSVKRMKKDIINFQKLGLISFHDSAPDASKDSDLHWVCVSTPEGIVDEGADVRNVLAATDDLTPYIKNGSVIVYSSRTPIGNTHAMYSHVATRLNFSVDFNVAYFPLFIAGGETFEYFYDRQVHHVGCDNEVTRKIFDELFKPWGKGVTVFVDVNAAEFIKLVYDGMLATQLSYLNSVADFAEKTGVTLAPVVNFLKNDKKLKEDFHTIRAGFGGKDFIGSVKALNANAAAYGSEMMTQFMGVIQKSNSDRVKKAFQKLKYSMDGSVSGKRVLILGAAYKPNTDDIQYSPSVMLASMINNSGGEVIIHDPVCSNIIKKEYPYFRQVRTLNAVKKMEGFDIIVFGTMWEDYFKMLPSDYVHIMSSLNVLDLTGELNHIMWLTEGWNVDSMGEINLT
jgi:UDPglucose 6-dehydrogenase